MVAVDIPMSLRLLSGEARELMAALLNTNKVISSKGEVRLPRDWRGLAHLANIPQQVVQSITDEDKTARVLELWTRSGCAATVNHLLEHLRLLDRHDLRDDLLDLHRKNRLLDVTRPPEHMVASSDETDYLTYEDVLYGSPQMYHAYVLYADADQGFVGDLLRRLRDQDFKLCTKDHVLPLFATEYEPISRLISERCLRIILVYSPHFLDSPANRFYTQYAHADGIENGVAKIIPCIFSECALPKTLRYVTKLRLVYPNFWDRLSVTLRTPIITRSHSSELSQVRITEVPSSESASGNCLRRVSVPFNLDIRNIAGINDKNAALKNPQSILAKNPDFGIREQSTVNTKSNSVQKHDLVEQRPDVGNPQHVLAIAQPNFNDPQQMLASSERGSNDRHDLPQSGPSDGHVSTNTQSVFSNLQQMLASTRRIVSDPKNTSDLAQSDENNRNILPNLQHNGLANRQGDFSSSQHVLAMSRNAQHNLAKQPNVLQQYLPDFLRANAFPRNTSAGVEANIGVSQNISQPRMLSESNVNSRNSRNVSPSVSVSSVSSCSAEVSKKRSWSYKAIVNSVKGKKK